MKIVIIGAVAAGTSAAAKARRNDENAEIKVYDMDYEISYSGCGLPYYIGTEIDSSDRLVPRDALFFKKKYNIDIFIRHQVIDLNLSEKSLTVRNLNTQEVFKDSYDKLVLATGASATVPQIEGINKQNVFTLRNVGSADSIRSFLIKEEPKNAVIVGSGFIGLELAENLTSRGTNVTLVEMADHVMTSLDSDIAAYLEAYLKEKGVSLFLNDSVVKLKGDSLVSEVALRSGVSIPTDLVIMSVGVRPNVELAKNSGLDLGETGAIKVNKKLQTSNPDVYACGDCAESYSLITGKAFYRPLGSTANKMGRIVGDQITVGTLEFRGGLGTGIFKVFDMAVAQTGLSEKEAIKEGFDIEVCHNIKTDKPEYFHGKEMVIKAIADRKTGKLLGAQIIGESGVDKRIDVFASAISFGAKAEDLFHLDLAYAPPFSTTKDPVMYTGMILDNALNQNRRLMTAAELQRRLPSEAEKITVIDARVPAQYEKSHIEGAINIQQENLRNSLESLDKEKTIVTYCNKGVTGNAAQNILINNGFKNVFNLSGGYSNYKKTIE